MKLYVQNTLTRQMEEFIPLMNDPHYKGEKKDRVCMYSCGPTVYGDAHIGNLRAFWFADVLKCTIKYFLEMPIAHIMNITDVGHLTDDGDQGQDKMEKGSKRDGESAWDIAAKYGQRFIDFNAEFHNEAPDQYTRATDYIKEQIDIVRTLMGKGLTYVIHNDGIYMDTGKLEDYGKMLPEGHLEGLQDGARVEDHGKRSKTDFALWKFSPRDEQRQMEWIFDGSRAGHVINDDNRSSLTDHEKETMGFPGWHIECSAMASATLGENMDIHTGGRDHIPVHHTNEIAQSEHSFCKHKPWVKYWMHNQFLNFDGLKLSKSLGNAFTLPEIKEKGYDALDLRYFFFCAQYCNFQDFNWVSLDKAKTTRRNLQKKLQGKKPTVQLESRDALKQGVTSTEGNELVQGIEEALGANLNTAKLLAAINLALHQPNNDIYVILDYLDRTLLKCDLFEAEDAVDVAIPAAITALAEQRLEAKSQKNYELSDQLRDQISAAGYVVHDSKDGYTLEKK